MISKLLLDNDFMVNLDLLSTNCAIYGNYESFSNKDDDTIENFANVIVTDEDTGEKLKLIDGLPVKYYNTNINKYVDLILADFYWFSSYQTYLPGGVNSGKPSYEAIKQAFTKFHVRSVHFDVYSNSTTIGDPNAVPIVRTDKMYYNFDPLDFYQCLETVKRYAWYKEEDKSMPLIIYLDMKFNADNVMYEKIYYALMKVFWRHLIDKKYSFAGRGGIFPIGKIKMSDAIGKVIIVSSVYPTRTLLDEIINGEMKTTTSFCSITNYTKDYKDYGGLSLTTGSSTIIDNNKTNLSFMYSENLSDTNTINNSKVDLANPDFDDCLKYGVQFVMMSLFLPDDHLYKSYKYFKDRDFKMALKAKSLRHIETLNEEVKQQNPLLSYTTKEYNIPISGFFSTKKSGVTVTNT